MPSADASPASRGFLTLAAIAALVASGAPTEANDPPPITPGGVPCSFSGYRGAFHIDVGDGVILYERLVTDGDLGVFSYYADDHVGLAAVDVTDPEKPVWLGGFASEDPRAFILRDGLLYLEEDFFPASLTIYDLSDPADARPLGSITTDNLAHRMALGDGVLCLLIGDTVRVVDVSDPNAPAEVGAIDLGYNLDDIAAEGDLLYLLDGNAGLTVYDLSDPTEPESIGYLALPGVFTNSNTRSRISIDGPRMVVSGLLDLALVDISDPAAPDELACVRRLDVIGSFGGAYREPLLQGGVLYLTDESAGIIAIDWTDPAAPVIKGQQDTPGNLRSLAITDGFALVADESEGIGIVALSSLNTVQPLLGFWQHIFTESDFTQAAVEDGIAYQIAYDTQLEGYVLLLADVTDPAAPFWLATYHSDAEAMEDVEVRDGIVFLATGEDGLEVVDCSDPHSPTFMYRFRPTKSTVQLAISDNQLALASRFQPVVVLGIEDPRNITLDAVAFPIIDARPEALALDDGVVYVAGQFSGDPAVESIDIRNPFRPVSAVALTPARYDRIAVERGVLYAIPSDKDLFVSRTDDLHNPTRTPLRLFGAASLDVSDGVVHLAGGQAVRMYEVTDPSEPAALIGSVATRDGVGAIRVEGGIAYATGRGMEIIDVGVSCGHCPADFDADGAVGFCDVAAFIAAFNAGDNAADFDGSGSLDFGDVAAFIGAYGAGCP